jgi:hypothetical protein
MDRHDATAGLATFEKNMFEDSGLVMPMPTKLRVAIEPDFPDIARFMKKYWNIRPETGTSLASMVA